MIIVSQLREMKWCVLMNECPRRRRDARMLGAYERGATALISSLSTDDDGGDDERQLPLPEHRESARSWPGTSQPKLFLFLLPNQPSRYFHKFQPKTLRQRHSAPLTWGTESDPGLSTSEVGHVASFLHFNFLFFSPSLNLSFWKTGTSCSFLLLHCLTSHLAHNRCSVNWS